MDSSQKDPTAGETESYLGVLEIYIHQARDIHNVCIYHKQDVYAKFCLTNDPDVTASTRIINGGGRNPVFDEGLQLKVKTIDSSLKCELWMLSRVKNYLEDQLLGFSLVPVADIVASSGKSSQEFSLSSTDLFHSPAGYVELSLSYSGSSPAVRIIPALSSSGDKSSSLSRLEKDDSLPSEYTKIEFLDLKIANENQIMVSEYIGIPCTNLVSDDSGVLITAENSSNIDEDPDLQVVESFSSENSGTDAPNSSVPDSCDRSAPTALLSPSCPQSDSQKQVSSQVEKIIETVQAERSSSSDSSESAQLQPLINIKIEPEQLVKQQDIVDMYMKSMNQFTESLAKMKLPLDIENGGSGSPNTNSLPVPKFQPKGTGTRVFYGSRAFF